MNSDISKTGNKQDIIHISVEQYLLMKQSYVNIFIMYEHLYILYFKNTYIHICTFK